MWNQLECTTRRQEIKGKIATEIAIWIGPVLVATKILGGHYTAAMGLMEFKRNWKRFKPEMGWNTALDLRMVA